VVPLGAVGQPKLASKGWPPLAVEEN